MRILNTEVHWVNNEEAPSEDIVIAIFPSFDEQVVTIPARFNLVERVKIIQALRHHGLKLKNLWLHLGQASFSL